MTQNNNGPSKLETLMGRTEMAAVFYDGQPQRVKVRQLAVKYFPRLLELLARPDEIEKICLLTGMERERAESLTPESHEEILKEGDKLNADFFERWRLRQPKQEVSPILEALTKLPPSVAEALIEKFSPKNDPKNDPKAEARPGDGASQATTSPVGSPK